ncbi:MAG: SDR family NAD(P)-dependent oxidoreductase [Elainellaceae cyanobacterium]
MAPNSLPPSFTHSSLLDNQGVNPAFNAGLPDIKPSRIGVDLQQHVRQPDINSSTVFVVTGGGKGITAQCVIRMAQQFRCKWILLGRSPLTDEEPAWAQDCFDEATLKKRIVEHFLVQGKKPTPGDIKIMYGAIASRREILNTLHALEQAGSQAEYLSIDVTDAHTLQTSLTEMSQRLGTITGILHGAGNLADKLIEKKTEHDFETVYAPKVKGLENLLRCISPDRLNYLVLFSSVAGFYGNMGQADYAIANEILNKTAHLVKRKYPNCHVVAINWGPWEGGMVSPALKKAFAEFNIETIPIDVGTRWLIHELAPEHQDTAQVVIGSPIVFPKDTWTPDLQTYRIHRTLTVDANPFLQDHVIAGYPVLPATCAMAWLNHACEQLYPGYTGFVCKHFRVLKGIIFDDHVVQDYVLDLKELSKPRPGTIEFDTKIWSRNKAGKIRYHFSAQVQLVKQVPPAPTSLAINLTPDYRITDSGKSLYQNGSSTLFHGPCFQGIKQVINISRDTITVECALAQISEQQQGQFPVQTINSYLCDVQVHPMWLWVQHFYQQACLPAEIERVEQFVAVPFDQTFYISCDIHSKTETALVANLIAHDRHGKIYSRMIGAKGTVIPMAALEAQS